MFTEYAEPKTADEDDGVRATPAYSADEIRKIARLLQDGLSASQIAARVRGKSRNSIIGLVRRNEYLRGIGFERKSGQIHKGKTPAPKSVGSTWYYSKYEDALIAKMLQEGATATLISCALPHRSRGSIINHVRNKPHLRAIGFANAKKRKTRPVFKPVVLEGSLNLPLHELDADQCKYATNDAQGREVHLFCGQPVKEGHSWCEGHYRVVHGHSLGG